MAFISEEKGPVTKTGKCVLGYPGSCGATIEYRQACLNATDLRPDCREASEAWLKHVSKPKDEHRKAAEDQAREDPKRLNDERFMKKTADAINAQHRESERIAIETAERLEAERRAYREREGKRCNETIDSLQRRTGTHPDDAYPLFQHNIDGAKRLIEWAREQGIILHRVKLGDLELDLHDPAAAALHAQVENVHRVDGADEPPPPKPPPADFYQQFAHEHADAKTPQREMPTKEPG